ncbi:hypothetical protein [Peribacillus sp. TH27]|uniref:hypothetical protein n=1 Tax=Peribacillus sp. TH27 TaxID=2798484 RepID=UPI001913EC10|nr:hypothetical protein [Peribacillus sp. TH27]MBK5463472.1 hypothetical protein [Peribacillus sp. TH27]
MQVPLFGIGVTGNLAGPLLLPTDPSSTGGAQVFVNGVPVGPVFTSLAGAPIVGTVTALISAAGTVEIQVVGIGTRATSGRHISS